MSDDELDEVREWAMHTPTKAALRVVCSGNATHKERIIETLGVAPDGTLGPVYSRMELKGIARGATLPRNARAAVPDRDNGGSTWEFRCGDCRRRVPVSERELFDAITRGLVTAPQSRPRFDISMR